MISFLVKLRELSERIDRLDVPYWLPKFREQQQQLEKCGFELVPLSHFISSLESGTGIYDLSEDAGWHYINVNNITSMGINVANCGFVSSPPDENATNTLRFGDVATGRVGTIGIFCKYSLDVPAYISDNVFRIRLKECNADYILAVLNSSIVQNQIEREAKGSLQRVVNKQTIRNLLIPIPPCEVQERIVTELNAAYAAKRKADKKAADLLASIEHVVLDALGIPPLPPPDTSLSARIFTVSSQNIGNNRLDAYHYRPFFRLNVERIRKNNCQLLKYLVELSHDMWGQEKWNDENDGYFPYLEIGAISTEDGSVLDVSTIPIAEAPSRARMIANRGDLLVSLTRPTRKAIAFVPEAFDTLVASTGFAIIRKNKPSITMNYLFEVLRTELCTLQFDQRSSGWNYPAITEEQLLKCIIPVPPLSIQEEIATKASSIRAKAKAMKSAAATELAASKKKIESI